MIEFSLPLNLLRAVAVHAAKKDLRVYLQGVHLRLGVANSTAFATDGYTGAAVLLPSVEHSIEMVIPVGAIPKTGDTLHIKVVDRRDNGVYLLEVSAEKHPTIITETLYGKYPDWKIVFKSLNASDLQLKHEHFPFNPEQLAKFAESSKALERRKDAAFKVVLTPRGDTCLVNIEGRTDFVGIGTAVRRKEPEIGVPQWAMS